MFACVDVCYKMDHAKGVYGGTREGDEVGARLNMQGLGTKKIVVAGLFAVGFALSVIGGMIVLFHCQRPEDRRLETSLAVSSPSPPHSDQNEQSCFVEARRRMVEGQLQGRDITDREVLKAMSRVPRQCFVPEDFQKMAYTDGPLPIGHGQTISQPYIVALMTQVAHPAAESRALEIGTGSGYQAAVLAELCKEVFSIEIIQSLADSAGKRLANMGYKNVVIRCGDGYQGWPEHAPFDVILVTAAPDHVPQPLVDQLAAGGRLVIPVGHFFQDLLVVQKWQDGSVHRESVVPVRFVPMTGEAMERFKK
jgi:protein-L-isoaspartate(D-aspartate) O-methyltransferase